MADYKQTQSGNGIIRTVDGAFIPPDLANSDWQMYQQWLLLQGNVPDVADPLSTDEHNAPILAQLATLDAASVRPLRAINNAIQSSQTPNPADVAKLAAYDAQAATLRSQLK